MKPFVKNKLAFAMNSNNVPLLLYTLMDVSHNNTFEPLVISINPDLKNGIVYINTLNRKFSYSNVSFNGTIKFQEEDEIQKSIAYNIQNIDYLHAGINKFIPNAYISVYQENGDNTKNIKIFFLRYDHVENEISNVDLMVDKSNLPSNMQPNLSDFTFYYKPFMRKFLFAYVQDNNLFLDIINDNVNVKNEKQIQIHRKFHEYSIIHLQFETKSTYNSQNPNENKKLLCVVSENIDDQILLFQIFEIFISVKNSIVSRNAQVIRSFQITSQEIPQTVFGHFSVKAAFREGYLIAAIHDTQNQELRYAFSVNTLIQTERKKIPMLYTVKSLAFVKHLLFVEHYKNSSVKQVEINTYALNLETNTFALDPSCKFILSDPLNLFRGPHKAAKIFVREDKLQNEVRLYSLGSRSESFNVNGIMKEINFNSILQGYKKSLQRELKIKESVRNNTPAFRRLIQSNHNDLKKQFEFLVPGTQNSSNPENKKEINLLCKHLIESITDFTLTCFSSELQRQLKSGSIRIYVNAPVIEALENTYILYLKHGAFDKKENSTIIDFHEYNTLHLNFSENLQLSDSLFYYSKFHRCIFKDCTFNEMLPFYQMKTCFFKNCTFQSIDISIAETDPDSETNVDYTCKFTDCTLSLCKFDFNVNTLKTVFVNCEFNQCSVKERSMLSTFVQLVNNKDDFEISTAQGIYFSDSSEDVEIKKKNKKTVVDPDSIFQLNDSMEFNEQIFEYNANNPFSMSGRNYIPIPKDNSLEPLEFTLAKVLNNNLNDYKTILNLNVEVSRKSDLNFSSFHAEHDYINRSKFNTGKKTWPFIWNISVDGNDLVDSLNLGDILTYSKDVDSGNSLNIKYKDDYKFSDFRVNLDVVSDDHLFHPSNWTATITDNAEQKELDLDESLFFSKRIDPDDNLYTDNFNGHEFIINKETSLNLKCKIDKNKCKAIESSSLLFRMIYKLDCRNNPNSDDEASIKITGFKKSNWGKSYIKPLVKDNTKFHIVSYTLQKSIYNKFNSVFNIEMNVESKNGESRLIISEFLFFQKVNNNTDSDLNHTLQNGDQFVVCQKKFFIKSKDIHDVSKLAFSGQFLKQGENIDNIKDFESFVDKADEEKNVSNILEVNFNNFPFADYNSQEEIIIKSFGRLIRRNLFRSDFNPIQRVEKRGFVTSNFNALHSSVSSQGNENYIVFNQEKNSFEDWKFYKLFFVQISQLFTYNNTSSDNNIVVIDFYGTKAQTTLGTQTSHFFYQHTMLTDHIDEYEGIRDGEVTTFYQFRLVSHDHFSDAVKHPIFVKTDNNKHFLKIRGFFNKGVYKDLNDEGLMHDEYHPLYALEQKFDAKYSYMTSLNVEEVSPIDFIKNKESISEEEYNIFHANNPVSIKNVTFNDCDFKPHLSNSVFAECIFQNSNFIATKSSGDNESNFENLGFIECTFTNHTFKALKEVRRRGMTTIIFYNCTFESCTFINIWMNNLSFVSCTFIIKFNCTNCIFEECLVFNEDISNCNFEYANTLVLERINESQSIRKLGNATFYVSETTDNKFEEIQNMFFLDIIRESSKYLYNSQNLQLYFPLLNDNQTLTLKQNADSDKFIETIQASSESFLNISLTTKGNVNSYSVPIVNNSIQLNSAIYVYIPPFQVVGSKNNLQYTHNYNTNDFRYIFENVSQLDDVQLYSTNNSPFFGTTLYTFDSEKGHFVDEDNNVFSSFRITQGTISRTAFYLQYKADTDVSKINQKVYIKRNGILSLRNYFINSSNSLLASDIQVHEDFYYDFQTENAINFGSDEISAGSVVVVNNLVNNRLTPSSNILKLGFERNLNMFDHNINIIKSFKTNIKIIDESSTQTDSDPVSSSPSDQDTDKIIPISGFYINEDLSVDSNNIFSLKFENVTKNTQITIDENSNSKTELKVFDTFKFKLNSDNKIKLDGIYLNDNLNTFSPSLECTCEMKRTSNFAGPFKINLGNGEQYFPVFLKQFTAYLDYKEGDLTYSYDFSKVNKIVTKSITVNEQTLNYFTPKHYIIYNDNTKKTYKIQNDFNANSKFPQTSLVMRNDDLIVIMQNVNEKGIIPLEINDGLIQIKFSAKDQDNNEIFKLQKTFLRILHRRELQTEIRRKINVYDNIDVSTFIKNASTLFSFKDEDEDNFFTIDALSFIEYNNIKYFFNSTENESLTKFTLQAGENKFAFVYKNIYQCKHFFDYFQTYPIGDVTNVLNRSFTSNNVVIKFDRSVFINLNLLRENIYLEYDQANNSYNLIRKNSDETDIVNFSYPICTFYALYQDKNENKYIPVEHTIWTPGTPGNLKEDVKSVQRTYSIKVDAKLNKVNDDNVNDRKKIKIIFENSGIDIALDKKTNTISSFKSGEKFQNPLYIKNLIINKISDIEKFEIFQWYKFYNFFKTYYITNKKFFVQSQTDLSSQIFQFHEFETRARLILELNDENSFEDNNYYHIRIRQVSLEFEILNNSNPNSFLSNENVGTNFNFIVNENRSSKFFQINLSNPQINIADKSNINDKSTFIYLRLFKNFEDNRKNPNFKLYLQDFKLLSSSEFNFLKKNIKTQFKKIKFTFKKENEYFFSAFFIDKIETEKRDNVPYLKLSFKNSNFIDPLLKGYIDDSKYELYKIEFIETDYTTLNGLWNQEAYENDHILYKFEHRIRKVDENDYFCKFNAQVFIDETGANQALFNSFRYDLFKYIYNWKICEDKEENNMIFKENTFILEAIIDKEYYVSTGSSTDSQGLAALLIDPLHDNEMAFDAYNEMNLLHSKIISELGGDQRISSQDLKLGFKNDINVDMKNNNTVSLNGPNILEVSVVINVSEISTLNFEEDISATFSDNCKFIFVGSNLENVSIIEDFVNDAKTSQGDIILKQLKFEFKTFSVSNFKRISFDNIKFDVSAINNKDDVFQISSVDTFYLFATMDFQSIFTSGSAYTQLQDWFPLTFDHEINNVYSYTVNTFTNNTPPAELSEKQIHIVTTNQTSNIVNSILSSLSCTDDITTVEASSIIHFDSKSTTVLVKDSTIFHAHLVNFNVNSRVRIQRSKFYHLYVQDYDTFYMGPLNQGCVIHGNLDIFNINESLDLADISVLGNTLIRSCTVHTLQGTFQNNVTIRDSDISSEQVQFDQITLTDSNSVLNIDIHTFLQLVDGTLFTEDLFNKTIIETNDRRLQDFFQHHSDSNAITKVSDLNLLDNVSLYTRLGMFFHKYHDSDNVDNLLDEIVNPSFPINVYDRIAADIKFEIFGQSGNSDTFARTFHYDSYFLMDELTLLNLEQVSSIISVENFHFVERLEIQECVPYNIVLLQEETENLNLTFNFPNQTAFINESDHSEDFQLPAKHLRTTYVKINEDVSSSFQLFQDNTFLYDLYPMLRHQEYCRFTLIDQRQTLRGAEILGVRLDKNETSTFVANSRIPVNLPNISINVVDENGHIFGDTYIMDGNYYNFNIPSDANKVRFQVYRNNNNLPLDINNPFTENDYNLLSNDQKLEKIALQVGNTYFITCIQEIHETKTGTDYCLDIPLEMYIPQTRLLKPAKGSTSDSAFSRESITFAGNPLTITYKLKSHLVVLNSVSNNFIRIKAEEIQGILFDNYYSAVTSGDPHIFAMDGSVYELPRKRGIFRMLQGDDIIINAKTRDITPSESRNILSYCQEMGYPMKGIVSEGVFYDRIFISIYNKEVEYDFYSNAVYGKDKNHFTLSREITLNAGNLEREMSVRRIRLKHKKYGTIDLHLQHYKNPQILYGLRIHVDRIYNLTGLLISEFNIDFAKLKKFKDKEKKTFLKSMMVKANKKQSLIKFIA